MKDIFEKRIARLRKIIKENNIDTMMIMFEETRRYLSGFTGEDSQFDESAGVLFITGKKLLLATDSRFELQAQNEADLYEIYCYKKGLANEITMILKSMGTKKLGFESMRQSLYQYSRIEKRLDEKNMNVELIAADNLIENLRIIKDKNEIDLMKKALTIAEESFIKIKNIISIGMTEKELAWALEKKLRESGAESLSFSSIIASGPNSALPHAIPGDRKLKKKEPLLFDWGVKYKGYCSDISRTVIVEDPGETFEKVYKVVNDAQQMAIKAIKEGVSSIEIDKIARDHINKMGFEGKFGHGLGHGLGLAVHEPPRLGPIKNYTLKQGMVVTVEPGIYIPGWGGVRLENMVVVRKDSDEVLNSIDNSDYIIN